MIWLNGGDEVTHKELLNVIIGVGIPIILSILGLAITHGRTYYQHRMLWREYCKKHGINGNGG